MITCPNCEREIKWYQGYTPFFSTQRFCERTCAQEFKNNPKPVLDRSVGMKNQVLGELKKQELKRQTELELHNRKPTQKDFQRQEKIRELEEELKPSTGVAIAGGSVMGAMTMAMTGFFMLGIGFLLTLTFIGSIIGIPLMAIGVILLAGAGIIALLGIGGGTAVGIGEAIHKARRTSTRKESKKR